MHVHLEPLGGQGDDGLLQLLRVDEGVAGVVCLVLGIVALVLGQPYAVYYPLLLIGVLAAVLGGVGIPVSRQRFAEAELRRMQALDAR